MIPPKISTIKSIAKANKVTKGAILIFLDESGTVDGASYGINKVECAKIGKYMDSVIDNMAYDKNSPY